MNDAVMKKRKIKEGMVKDRTVKGIIADVLIYFVVALAAFVAIIPFWHVLMSSISDPFNLLTYDGLVLYPIGGLSGGGYKLLFAIEGFWTGWKNTIINVVCTVGIGFVLNVLGGYALSRNTPLKKFFMIYLMITIVFGGGMIPTYMVLYELGLVRTRWAIILPEATMAMYLVVSMNAFMTVPESTVEAAQLDGAGHLRIMFQVMIPQCLSLFFVTVINTFVASYNSWLSSQMYIPFDQDLWPVQLWINKIVDDYSTFLTSSNPDYNRYLVQFATTVISVAPLLIAFPFFQKKIEAGMILGGVKG